MAQITVPQSQAFINYSLPSGAGPNSSYPINFPFFALSDISASWIAPDGATGTYDPGAYQVSGVAADDGYSSGTIVILPSIGPCTLVIARNTPMEKLSNWPTTGAFSIYAENTLWSKHTAWHQQHQRNIGRTIRVPMGEGVLSLPGAAKRAKKMLVFDAQGAPALSSADADAIIADAEAAAARAETAANHAATSETNAAVSANSAASSANAASSSATAANVANTAAQNAASQAAASNAAAGSARDAAAASATQAANSATTATTQASNALTSAMNAATAETSAAGSATAAANSATAAAASADEAEYWAGQAESLTAPPASETVPGIVEIATQAEVNAGTLDDNFVVTPLKLKTLLNATGGYVSKAGDTMGGPLTINKATAGYPLQVINSVDWSSILVQTTAAGAFGAAVDLKTTGRNFALVNYGTYLALRDVTAAADRLTIDTTSVCSTLALGVWRKPTPGIHFHVNGPSGDIYSLVSTDSANIAVSRLATPQSDYGWCANGTTNNLYLWDYKRSMSPFAIDASVVVANQPLLVGYGTRTADAEMLGAWNASYCNMRVETGTNYWARLTLKNSVRNWNVNVEPDGSFSIRDETGVKTYLACSGDGKVFTADRLGVGTWPASGFVLHTLAAGVNNAVFESLSAADAALYIKNSSKAFGLVTKGNGDFWFYDNTRGAYTWTIEGTTGKLSQWGDMSVSGSFNAGAIGCTGDCWVGGQVRGAEGDAGCLKSYNSANKITFRWGSGAGGSGLYMRIDGTEVGKIYTV